MSATSGAADARKPALKPRDAATLIIVDRTEGEARVLMGRRREDQVFMPGKFVFPGGRVDKQDRFVEAADELRPAERDKLLLDMKGGASKASARSLALAAIRETFEEAGIVIGTTGRPRRAASGLETWQAFLDHGFLPKLSELTLFARAITPPGRPRRYDTRFFCIEAAAIAARLDTSDGELSGVHWVTISDAHQLDLPPITRVILEDLSDRLKGEALDDAALPVPYYHHRNGTFRREMLVLGQPVGAAAADDDGDDDSGS
jgi:8-oxo-dGTP pyrophosphatase MutT (NUDIX family)